MELAILYACVAGELLLFFMADIVLVLVSDMVVYFFYMFL